MMISTSRFLLGAATAVLFALVILSGCSRDGAKEEGDAGATISGSVLFNGAPLPGGKIKFYPKSGGPMYDGVITPEGTYLVKGVPPGDAVVTIENQYLKGNTGEDPVKMMAEKGAGDTSADAAKMKERMKQGGGFTMKTVKSPAYVPIPEKYADKNKSGLTMAVQKGSQEKTFDLK